MPRSPGIAADLFHRLATEYRRAWPVHVCAVAASGRVVRAEGTGIPADTPAWRGVRQFAVNEALRWGEATVSYGPNSELLWAIPLMHNMRVLGGLIAGLSEPSLLPEGSGRPTLDIRRACTHLRELVERENLTNAALLETRRHEYQREQRRAEAIHAVKHDSHFALRQMYLREEPDLVAAIRRGDRGAARDVLNRLLVAVIHYAADRFDLVKSLFMELVVTVCRTAVEAGGASEELLGANYTYIAELAKVESQEQLAPWLHEMLERVLDSIYRHREATAAVLVGLALEWMEEHLAEGIRRDEAAAAVHLSPAHFSRLFKQQVGRTFKDMLTRLRTNRAAELLARSNRPIGGIALDCGFPDQSYFTKVFTRSAGMTPRQYREQARKG